MKTLCPSLFLACSSRFKERLIICLWSYAGIESFYCFQVMSQNRGGRINNLVYGLLLTFKIRDKKLNLCNQD